MKPLKELTRPHIWRLNPYKDIRSDKKKRENSIMLDANESPYNSPLNRYPDSQYTELKERVSKIKGVDKSCIFTGNGTDEAIDILYRCFTRPGQDNVVAMEPTYKMFRFFAGINDVEYRTVLLNTDFQITADMLLAKCNPNTKIIWLCSPNNPTGNSIDRGEIIKTLNRFSGLVVVDEAYSDFSTESPLRLEIKKYPNLIVLNTLSNSWGCASIRLGMAFAQKEIIDIMNKVRPPYNIGLPTQKYALEALKEPYETDKWIRMLLLERGRMIEAFSLLPLCEKVFPTETNFFLVKIKDQNAVYEYLQKKGIMVHNMAGVPLCDGCLRITVGTKSENNELLSALRQY